jgi:hypothetical protein
MDGARLGSVEFEELVALDSPTHPDWVSGPIKTIRNTKKIRGLRKFEILDTLAQKRGVFDAKKLIQLNRLITRRGHNLLVSRPGKVQVFNIHRE